MRETKSCKSRIFFVVIFPWFTEGHHSGDSVHHEVGFQGLADLRARAAAAAARGKGGVRQRRSGGYNAAGSARTDMHAQAQTHKIAGGPACA